MTAPGTNQPAPVVMGVYSMQTKRLRATAQPCLLTCRPGWVTVTGQDGTALLDAPATALTARHQRVKGHVTIEQGGQSLTLTGFGLPTSEPPTPQQVAIVTEAVARSARDPQASQLEAGRQVCLAQPQRNPVGLGSTFKVITDAKGHLHLSTVAADLLRAVGVPVL